MPGSSWWTVATGASHTCAVKTTGSLWCWGLNSDGRLGNGTTTAANAPSQVGTSIAWRQVTAGNTQTCAVQQNSSVWCWGGNTAGQLGLGSAVATQTTPAQLPGLTGRPVTGGPAAGVVALIVA